MQGLIMEDSGRAFPCSGPETMVNRRQARTKSILGGSLRYAVSLVIIFGALVVMSAPVLAGDEIGSATVVVRAVTGEVEGEVHQLAPLDDIYQNETIETALSSASNIVFLDDTRISLGPNTRLTLDKFVFDPDPERGAFVMTTVKGVLRFVSGNLAKESYQIRTPTATIGVRGTVLNVVTDPEFGTAVMLQCPTRPEYRWQPEKREEQLEEQENPGSLTVESLSGQIVTLNQCDICTTIEFEEDPIAGKRYLMSAPGVCPDWAIEKIEQLDELVGEPGPDPENTNSDDVSPT